MIPTAPNFVVFAGTSHPELSKEVAKNLKVKLGKISIQRFPDQEIFLEVLEDVSNKDVYVIQSLAFAPNEYLMELLIMVDALKRASARRITAVIPYYGYCRQDRQDKPQVPITAKLVADLLQKAGVACIIAADLHAGQVQGFFDIPVINLQCMPLLAKVFRKFETDKLVVVTPDVGSIKLGRDYANHLNVGFAVVNKQRLKAGEVEALQVIGDVKGKDVLLADDMCSTGETLTSAAKACREKGAKRIWASMTHGLFVGEALPLINQSCIEALITTNTVPFKGLAEKTTKNVHVASAAPLFARAILNLAT
ncbi:Ribose-phosphate pyrophosphokinase [Neochlamydia sp. EPS4]|uniref:ribose-phosphate diphosphokinase n=1 Tax=Neochlamydia sp. EPS4 TaxID=1478175 RepID=UPI0005836A06|nr:ribose-phosphate pyrophosphokinase [Neochlamydia sp. EPS4]KIC74787.1 Ribose-phosphate pyrophosphokinase [Neochlamydia sp. EPS4]